MDVGYYVTVEDRGELSKNTRPNRQKKDQN